VNETTSRTHGRSWLSPTEALVRHAPGGLGLQGRAAADEKVRYGACVGSVRLLLPEHLPSEVVAGTVIYPIPNTAPWFAGMINLRGNLVPVFDLHRLIGLPLGDDRPLLVLGRGAEAVAVPTDGLPRTVGRSVRTTHLPTVPTALEAYLSGAQLEGETIWLDLDLGRLFQALGRDAGGL
jgi:twitching motility protein PilI